MNFIQLLKTRTFWSMVIMFIAFILQLIGKSIDAAQQEVLVDQAVNIVSSVMAIIGALGVSYGRINATNIIKPPRIGYNTRRSK